MTPTSQSAVDELGRSPYVSLVTYRRNGAAVATPVWAVSDGSELFVWTRTDSGKIKRIRNNGRVTVTACDVRGRIAPGAPSAEGEAKLLDADGLRRVRKLLTRKYGWSFRIVDDGAALLRLGKRPHTAVAISL
ncbi:PPOX class F420-dependent oxidoreductase [Streptomyces sp. KR80]|uniref:PPOX class F420-dependent oxidoreductase n=1 Tax=Streptomyces sp. KR80 TaxID=3457426 RepID=UPI003FD363B4